MTRLLLLSGGLDSTAVAAMTHPDHCLTIDYGQVAAQAEKRAARQVAVDLRLPWSAITVPATDVGSGLMTGNKSHGPAPAGTPPEWWPFRNQLLITLGAAWGVTRGVTSIEVGTIASDGARHVDGTRPFLDAIDHVVALQEGHIRVEAPAAGMSAVELLRISGVTEAVLGWTHSCHRANLPCARCPGCTKRAETLHAAGLLQ